MSQHTDSRHPGYGRQPTADWIARIAGWRRDLVLSVSAQVVQKLPGLVAAIVLARHFDKDLIGQFFFCGVVATLAATLSHFGTDRQLRRTVAQRPSEALEMLGRVLPLRLSLSLLFWFAINMPVAILAPELLPISALTSLYVLMGDLFFTFSAVFVGLRWAGLRFAVGAIGPLLIALSSLTVFIGLSLPTVLVLYALANCLMLAVAVATTWARLGKVPLQWNWPSAWSIAAASLPFLLTDLVLLLQNKVDVLMIYALASPTEVANYEAPYRLLEVTRTLIRPLMMVFVPMVAAMAATGRWQEIRRLVPRLLVGVVVVGSLLAAACIAYSEQIVVIVWGESYAGSAAIFNVLALSTVPLFLVLANLHLLGALHQEYACLRILAITAAANTLMNAAVIPRFGGLGAAWTTFATECLAAAALLYLLIRASRSRSGSEARDG